MAKLTFNDEQAHVNLWNYMKGVKGFINAVRDGNTNVISNLIKGEIVASHHNKNHPLHFDNVSNKGFSGKSGKTSNHRKDYINKMNNSLHGLKSQLASRVGRNMFLNKYTAERIGDKHQKSKSTWTGQKSAQGRGDVKYFSPTNPKALHIQSIKSSKGSQAYSAGGNQFKATVNAAIKQLTKDQNVIKSVNSQVNEIGRLMDDMKGKTKSVQLELKNKAQLKLNSLFEYPGLKQKTNIEGLGGKVQFGKSVNSLLSVGSEKSQLHSDLRGVEVQTPRAALPKGKDRPGNIKGDVRTLTKANWIGKNSILSRSNSNLLGTKSPGGGFERIKSDLSFLESSPGLDTSLSDPKQMPTAVGQIGGV